MDQMREQHRSTGLTIQRVLWEGYEVGGFLMHPGPMKMLLPRRKACTDSQAGDTNTLEGGCPVARPPGGKSGGNMTQVLYFPPSTVLPAVGHGHPLPDEEAGLSYKAQVYTSILPKASNIGAVPCSATQTPQT